MLVFFDTEFTDLSLDPRLISIGLVSEDESHKFYAELSDTNYSSCCAPFVHEFVLPHLQGGNVLMTMDELTLRLGNWIESFEYPVQLATDSPSWDWPWITKLFNLPGTWPQNLAPNPISLPELAVAEEFKKFVDWTFESQSPRLRRHHALDDAIANQQAWLMCKAKNLLLEKRNANRQMVFLPPNNQRGESGG